MDTINRFQGQLISATTLLKTTKYVGKNALFYFSFAGMGRAVEPSLYFLKGLFRQAMKTLSRYVALCRVTTVGLFLIGVARHQATGFSLFT
jgi:hypothetical protein